MDPTLVGAGYSDAIGTRTKPGQTQVEYYNLQNPQQLAFGNPQELASFAGTLSGRSDITADNVFDVLKAGLTPRATALDQIKNDLNGFQQQTFDSQSPLNQRKSSSITDSINTEQSNYDTYRNEYTELTKKLQALAAPNYQDQYNQLRQTSGIAGIENDFANNQKTIRELPYVNRMNFGNAGVATEGQLAADTQQKGIPLEIQQGNLLDRLKLAQDFINNSLKFKEMDANASRQSLSDAVNIVAQTLDFSRTHLNDLLAQQKDQQERQQLSQQFAFENRISKPFYDIGGTVYRTSDRMPAHNQAEYRAMGGTGDFSDVQKLDISERFENQLATQKLALDREQLAYQQRATKYQLGNDAWGNPIVFNPRTGTFTGGDSTSGGSKPYYGLAPKIYDKAAAIVSQFDGEAIVKKYNIVADGKNYASTIDPKTKNAAEHQALIYGLAKALDPDSVVREGEYATIQKYSQSWIEAFGFNAQRIVDNQGLLSEDAIKKIQGVINQKYESVNGQYQNLYGEYSRRIDAATGVGGKGSEMLTDYSKAYTIQSDSTLNSLWGDGFTTSTPFDANKAFNSGGLGFNNGGSVPKNAQAFIGPIPSQYLKPNTKTLAAAQKLPQGTYVTLASNLIASYPPGSEGGQCGDFVGKIVRQKGMDYPYVGNSIAEKTRAVKNNGIPLSQAKIGSILITSENKKSGHVAYVIGINSKGWIVAESNFSNNNSERVSYGRVISFNSPKLIGALQPKPKPKIA
jgi:CHAP domain